MTGEGHRRRGAGAGRWGRIRIEYAEQTGPQLKGAVEGTLPSSPNSLHGLWGAKNWPQTA